MPEIEEIREVTKEPVVHITGDRDASYTGAMLVVVLMMFLFGLLFFINYDSIQSWTRQQQLLQQEPLPAPPTQLVPVPVPVPGPAGPPGPPGPQGMSGPQGPTGTTPEGTTVP